MVRQITLKAYTDTYTYSLFLVSIVNHHSSWSSSFICDNNENVFIKGKQRDLSIELYAVLAKVIIGNSTILFVCYNIAISMSILYQRLEIH
jgi:hypothetical protein